MEWFDSLLSRCYISQHYADDDERILASYDMKQLIDAYELSGCDVIICTARTHNGRWFADVGDGKMHAVLRGRDQLGTVLNHFHAKGKKVVAYFSAVHDAESFDEHPEWRQRNELGEAFCSTENPSGKVVCPNSDYRTHVMNQLRRLTSRYLLDGLLIDMPFFDTRLCYCDACQRNFHRRYGRNLPIEENDADMPLFRAMRNEDNQQFIADLCAAAKEAQANLPVYVQFAMMKKDSITAQTIEYARNADYIYDDLYLKQSGSLSWSVYPKLCAAISLHRPEIGMMVRPGGHDDCPQMKTVSQLRWEAASILASGCAVHFFDIMWANGDLQMEMFRRIGETAAMVCKGALCVQGVNAAEIAVYYSQADRLNRSPQDAEQYESRLMGLCRILCETQRPYRVVTNFENLNGISLLILPDTQYPPDGLGDFLEHGGNVLVTGGFAKRSDCVDNLRLLQGCSVQPMEQSYEKAFACVETKQGALWVTAWGGIERLTGRGATLIGSVMLPMFTTNADITVNVMSNPPAQSCNAAVYAVHRYGKGTMVTIPFSPDGDYLRLGLYEQQAFIASLVDELLPEPLLQVDAPECVEVSVFTNGRKLWVHLVNGQTENGKTYTIGSFADHGHPLSLRGYESRHVQRKMLPVSDVRLQMSRVPKHVAAVLGGSVTYKDQTLYLQKLSEYEIIEVEWSDER